MKATGPTVTRLLLRKLRDDLRAAGDTEGAKKIGRILRTPLAVFLFGEAIADKFPEVGEISDGTILERIKEIIDYVIEHQDEIMQIVEMVIKILALFGVIV